MINCGDDKTKEKGVWAGEVNYEKVTRKYMGKSVEDKGYFSRFVCTDSSLCQLPISSNTIVLLFLVEEGYLFRGNLCSAFR